MNEEQKTPKDEQLSMEELLANAREAKNEELPAEETAEIGLSADTEVITPAQETVSVPTAPEDNKTRLFDSPGKPAKEKEKEPLKKTKLALTALKYTGKFSFKTVLFLVRKALTYTLNVVLTAIIVGVLVGAVCIMAFMIYLNSYVNADFTGLDNLKYDSSLTTSLYYVDEHGNEIELEEDRLSSSENRLWVPYDEIPKILVDAYVAIEDQRFWEHNGVDTKRTLSAVYNFFVPSGSSFGGSTLTQQLIKNVTGENDTTIQRKIQEIFRALDVEKKYDKTEIMEMYLNTIYLSQNCYGVRAAAETYFGKQLSELTLNECAAIASIGKSPVKYDPILNPQYNLERRNLVLREMLAQGLIT
ncbi:MAG: transglycosylase domain-containing protein, partial [Clostridia bacterium]|nr:transglycosylase domain-containing protein [Clostridia bacterium]